MSNTDASSLSELQASYCGSSSYTEYTSLDWDAANQLFQCARNQSFEKAKLGNAAPGNGVSLVQVMLLISTLSLSVVLFWL